MKLPIIKPNVDRYREDIMPMLEDIVGSNMLTNVYNYTGKFEEAIREYLGVRNVIAVASGTAGLMLTLKALGIKGKEIIIPSFTFCATAAAVHWTGNRIRYADIDKTFTLDPEKVEETIGPDTGAILAVHMYGNPCHIRALEDIAEDHHIELVFDAAHALGSEYHSKKIGHFGAAEVFSLSPTKLLTSVEGGLIATNDDELGEKLRVLRNYGMYPDYTSDIAGINARMSELHGAVGLVQVPDIDTFVGNRNQYVSIYKDLLKDVNGIHFQDISNGHKSAHKDFSVVVDPDESGSTRDDIASVLEENGVGVKKYFYPPMHRLKAYENLDAHLPMTDYVSDNVLSLPIYNFMNNEDIEYICSILEDIIKDV